MTFFRNNTLLTKQCMTSVNVTNVLYVRAVPCKN